MKNILNCQQLLTSDDEQYLNKIAHSLHILGYSEAILSFGYQI
jgi:hypothetical protein